MKQVAIALTGVLVASVAQGASLDALRESWVSEARRLDRYNIEYAESAAQQDKALAALQAARKAMDAALGNPDVKVEELRRLEAELTRARDASLEAAEDAAGLRARMIDTIEEMERLDAEMEVPQGDLVSSADIDGLWRADWDKGPGYAVVKLETKGNLVTGTYRQTDGGSGSLTGTVTDTEMRLETIDAQTGGRAQLVVTLSADRRSASGTLVRHELAGAQPAAGNVEMHVMDEAEAHEAMQRVR